MFTRWLPRRGFKPRFAERVNPRTFRRRLADSVGISLPEADRLWDDYLALHEQQQYAERFGERKTLCCEEAFVHYVLLQKFRPPTLVEIGTQYGKSTRRFLDMREHAGIDFQVNCFDVEDQVREFSPGEACLHLEDVTDRVESAVLDVFPPGIIYLDAHPYYLLQNVISAVLKRTDWILTVHDCTRGLCNPRMTMSRDDPNITSLGGHWERHVLAEQFGVPDPLSRRLDHVVTENHDFSILPTRHGLGLIMPRQLRGKQS